MPWKSVRVRNDDGWQNKASKSIKQSSYDLTETEAPRTGPVQVCMSFLHTCSGCQINFSDFWMCERMAICFSWLFWGIFYFSWMDYPTSMWGFLFCLIISSFVMFSCVFLDVCSFLMKDRKTMEVGRNWEKAEGRVTIIWIYIFKKEKGKLLCTLKRSTEY